MRWRGQLGSVSLRVCFLTSCNLSQCSCCVGLYSVPVFLLCNFSLCSFRFDFHSVSSFLMAVAVDQGLWWLSLWGSPVGFRLFPLRGHPRVPRGLLSGSSLTRGRSPAAAQLCPLTFIQNRHRAAVRWNGLLGCAAFSTFHDSRFFHSKL